MSWKDNPIMTWDGQKVSDHGRSALNQDHERIGSDRRMHDGTLRRMHKSIKRTWNTSWENLPSTNTAARGMKTADGGMAGKDMEAFYLSHPGKFRMILRRGSAINKTVPEVTDSQLPFENDDFYIANVMMTEFSKDIDKRGASDLWSVSVTLEEV